MDSISINKRKFESLHSNETEIGPKKVKQDTISIETKESTIASGWLNVPGAWFQTQLLPLLMASEVVQWSFVCHDFKQQVQQYMSTIKTVLPLDDARSNPHSISLFEQKTRQMFQCMPMLSCIQVLACQTVNFWEEIMIPKTVSTLVLDEYDDHIYHATRKGTTRSGHPSPLNWYEILQCLVDRQQIQTLIFKTKSIFWTDERANMRHLNNSFKPYFQQIRHFEHSGYLTFQPMDLLTWMPQLQTCIIPDECLCNDEIQVLGFHSSHLTYLHFSRDESWQTNGNKGFFSVLASHMKQLKTLVLSWKNGYGHDFYNEIVQSLDGFKSFQSCTSHIQCKLDDPQCGNRLLGKHYKDQMLRFQYLTGLFLQLDHLEHIELRWMGNAHLAVYMKDIIVQWKVKRSKQNRQHIHHVDVNCRYAHTNNYIYHDTQSYTIQMPHPLWKPFPCLYL